MSAFTAWNVSARRASLGMTTEDAERYRRKADECRANARTANDDADRTAWLRLAEDWMELARSRNTDGGAPADADPLA